MIRKRLLLVSSMSFLLHLGASGCTTALDPASSGASTSDEKATPGAQPGPGAKGNPNPNPSNDGGTASGTNPKKSGATGKTGEGKGTGKGPEGETPEPECEDGQVDTNCLTFPDGTPIEFPTGMPVGACEPGTRVCSGGKWGSCEGAIAPKPKDDCTVLGDDSDCDGVPNAGCDCKPGEVRRCGETDQGACEYGEQRCIGGKWDKECVGAIYPQKEVCDGKGIDENCDGKADLDDDACDCLDKSQEYCQRKGNLEGDCRWGQKTCEAGKWSRCKEWAKPIREVCGKREAVKGVKWTGDENCDGGIDTSPYGEPGPAGCVNMMLDQDGDGFGKIGPDLSRIRGDDQVRIIGTACLCPERPDIQEKRAEGWVRVNGRENQDCGDCPSNSDGHLVYPGSLNTATRPNSCLTALRWPLALNRGPSELLDFDLNCDGVHKDPSNRNGEIDILECQRSGEFSCSAEGPGRLIPRGPRGVWCGGTFEFGECYAITRTEEPEAEAKSLFDSDGGEDSGSDDDGTDDNTEPKEPKKVFVRCGRRRTSGSHQIRCQ